MGVDPVTASLIGSGAGLLGNVLGGNAEANAQKAAAQNAANAQLGLEQQQFNQANQLGSNYRAQINKLLPYINGATGAATQYRNSIQPLQPGQNMASFGGQAVNSTPAAAQYGVPPNTGGQLSRLMTGSPQLPGMQGQPSPNPPGQGQIAKLMVGGVQ